MGNKKRPVSSNTSESGSDDSSFDDNGEYDSDYKHKQKLKTLKKSKKAVKTTKPKCVMVDKRGLISKALNSSNESNSVDKSASFGAISDRRGLLSQAIQKGLGNRAQNMCSSSNDPQPSSSHVSHTIAVTATPKITYCEYPNCTQNIVSEQCEQCAKVFIHKPNFCKDHIVHRIHLSFMLGDTLTASTPSDDSNRKITADVDKSAKLSRKLAGQFRSPTPPKGHKSRDAPVAVSPSHDVVDDRKTTAATGTAKRHRSPSPVANARRDQDQNIRQRGREENQPHAYKRQRSPSPVHHDNQRTKAGDGKYGRRSTRSRSRTRSKSPHRSVSISPAAATRRTAPDSQRKDDKRQRSLSPRVDIAPLPSRGRGKDATLPAWMTSTVVTPQNDRRGDSSPVERRRDNVAHNSRDRFADASPPRRSSGRYGDDGHSDRRADGVSRRHRSTSPTPPARSRGNDHVPAHDHYQQSSSSAAPPALPVAGIIPEWAKGQPKAETFKPSWAKNSRIYEKRFGTANPDEPPGTAKKSVTAVGRGRGRDMIQPAWMTEKSTIASAIAPASAAVEGMVSSSVAESGKAHDAGSQRVKRRDEDRSRTSHEKLSDEQMVSKIVAIASNILPSRRNPDFEDGEVCDTPDNSEVIRPPDMHTTQQKQHDQQHHHYEQQQSIPTSSTTTKSAGFIPQWATTPYGSKEAAVPAWKKDTSAMERALEKRRIAREQLQLERGQQ